MKTTVKKIETNRHKNAGGMFRRAMVICMAAVCLTAGCDDDDNKEIDSSMLVGKWTSVSATGTVEYIPGYGSDKTTAPAIAAALTNTVNSNMANYNLTNVSVLEFGSDGKMKINGVTYTYDDVTYKLLKGNELSLKFAGQPTTEEYAVNLKANELTLNDGDNTYIMLGIVSDIGDRELQKQGKSMDGEKLWVVKADITVKYVRKQ